MLRWMFWEQYNHEPNVATLRFWHGWIGEANWSELQRAQMPGKRAAGEAALKLMDEHLARPRLASSATASASPTSRSTPTPMSPRTAASGSPIIRRSQAWLTRVAAAPGYRADGRLNSSSRSLPRLAVVASLEDRAPSADDRPARPHDAAGDPRPGSGQPPSSARRRSPWAAPSRSSRVPASRQAAPARGRHAELEALADPQSRFAVLAAPAVQRRREGQAGADRRRRGGAAERNADAKAAERAHPDLLGRRRSSAARAGCAAGISWAAISAAIVSFFIDSPPCPSAQLHSSTATQSVMSDDADSRRRRPR